MPTHLPKPAGITGQARRVPIDVKGPPDQRAEYDRAKRKERERTAAWRRLQRVKRPLMVVGKSKLKVTIRRRLTVTVKRVHKVVKKTRTTLTIDSSERAVVQGTPTAKKELFPTPAAK
tara:strand:+ start:1990 stop:2343 length:354 start_codon:yes stop_codon:yes gene_type:complete